MQGPALGKERSPTHRSQSCCTFPSCNVAARILLVHWRERRQSRSLLGQAAELRRQEEISSQVSASRRAAGRLGGRLELSLESGIVRSERLRGGNGEFPWIDGLWAEVHRRGQR